MGAVHRESHLEVSFFMFLKMTCLNTRKEFSEFSKFSITCTEKNGEMNSSNSCIMLVRKFGHVTIPGADWITAYTC